jgi:hypothetical protein
VILRGGSCAKDISCASFFNMATYVYLVYFMLVHSSSILCIYPNTVTIRRQRIENMHSEAIAIKRKLKI